MFNWKPERILAETLVQGCPEQLLFDRNGTERTVVVLVLALTCSGSDESLVTVNCGGGMRSSAQINWRSG